MWAQGNSKIGSVLQLNVSITGGDSSRNSVLRVKEGISFLHEGRQPSVNVIIPIKYVMFYSMFLNAKPRVVFVNLCDIAIFLQLQIHGSFWKTEWNR